MNPRTNKRNRVTEALAAREAYGTNVAVKDGDVGEAVSAAREVHQHKTVPHLLMLINDDESHRLVCAHCGGAAILVQPYADPSTTDTAVFGLFKSFHGDCPAPKAPAGYFNTDEHTAPKRNPQYRNGNTIVELLEIKVSRTQEETYVFVDITDPKVSLRMSKADFVKFFVRVWA